MSVASVVSSALSGPALARLAGPPRMRLLPPHDVLAGSLSGLACRCRVAPGGAWRMPISFAAEGGSVGDAFVIEDTTNVKFPRELTVPGYTEPLVILGTGYREKFFVKVYAAAFYVDYSISVDTEQWREKFSIETFDASSVFDSIFKAPVVKSLNIILVRDVDGKTFVNALDDVIARRIKKPTADEESALSAFQNTFLGRNLKQRTGIYLTWLEPSRMLQAVSMSKSLYNLQTMPLALVLLKHDRTVNRRVNNRRQISISANQGPCQVDAEIKSATVNYALYDGFFSSSPVSPTLRSSTAQLLEAILTK